MLTTQYSPELLRQEVDGTFRIERVPVQWRWGKFVFAAGFAQRLEDLSHSHDLLLPQFPMMPQEARAIVIVAEKFKMPLFAVYQCDVVLPSAAAFALAKPLIDYYHRQACKAAKKILVLTRDYAEHSRVLHSFIDKCVEIPPLVSLSPADGPALSAMRARFAGPEEKLIGCVARLSNEKGIECLLEALDRLSEEKKNLKLVLVGEALEVIGDQVYRKRVLELLSRKKTSVTCVGYLPPDELSAFYAACDCTVLPSVNSTESFGLVQIESGLSGTPVVASDLPGVRQFVCRTGMGLLAEAGNPVSFARAIGSVLENPAKFTVEREKIEAAFAIPVAGSFFSKILAADSDRPRLSSSQMRAGMLRHSPPFTAMVRSREAQLLAADAPLESPILDVGCGTGDFSRYAVNGKDVIHIDQDFNSLRLAANVLSPGTVCMADVCQLPLDEEVISTVICNSVLEHVSHLDAALGELRRVMKPRARMILTVPTDTFASLLFFPRLFRKLGLRSWATRYENWFNRRSKHFHCYHPELWRDKLSSFGFCVLREEGYFNQRSHSLFDLLHYLSLPRLFVRRLCGRWVLSSTFSFNKIYEWLLGIPRFQSANDEKGSPYVYFVLEKESL